MQTPNLRPIELPSRVASGLVPLTVGIVAVTIGLLRGNAAATALGGVLLLTPLALGLVLRSGLRGLRLERQAPAKAFEGERVTVSLRLENRSSLPVFYPSLHEHFPPEIYSQKDVTYPLRIRPGESLERAYEGHCLLPRGDYTLGDTWLRLCDPYGWFELRSTATRHHRLRVYPRIHATELAEPMGELLEKLSEERVQRRAGLSTDLLWVREYRTGDSPRRIHWRLSARHGHPVVRETMRPGAGDVLLVLDTCRDALIGWGRCSSLEYSVSVAAAVAHHVLERGRRVRLLYENAGQPHLTEASGRDELMDILDALVPVRPSRRSRPLPVLLGEQRALVEQSSTLVCMVSPYLDTRPGLLAELATARARGQQQIAVVLHGELYGGCDALINEEEDARAHAEQLQAHGIDTVLVSCHQPLEPVLDEGLGQT